MTQARFGGADLNLLFGILALQMDFVTRDQLVVAMHAWVLDKTKTLGIILEEQKALGPAAHYLLTALVEEHLKQHDNDAQESLAALSSGAAIRDDLKQIADADVQASLGHVAQADDANSTLAFPAPGARGQRFRIMRSHAEGGLGKVYVAHDAELNREVALKEIKEKHANDAESRARFVLEAEITGGLEHPGIVPVYGLGTYADGRPFYAMRFIRGDSLKDAIERFHHPLATGERTDRALELRKLLGRLIDVCQAMQYAHDRGVIHRDLKPGNIMLGKYGETLVVDWGLAKAVGKREITSEEPTLRPGSASGSAETLPGHAIGTPAYMSPEQAAGRLDLVSPASDVYSLGATLYSLLTGKPSIDERDQVIALKKVCDGQFRRPSQHRPDIDPALEAICLKAMALGPGDRYPTPRALAEDLEFWLADKPVSAWPEPLRVKARRWTGKHRTLVTGVAAALVVGVVSLLIVTVLLSDANDANKILADKEKQARKHAEVLAKKEEITRLEMDRRREQAETLALRIEFEHYFAKADERPDLAMVGMASLLPKAERLKDPSVAELLRLQIGALRQGADRLKAIWPHQAKVVAVALSADGKWALTGSHDNTARVWESGKLLATLPHRGAITSVALSADGKTALTGSSDEMARLWDTATGKLLATLPHQAAVAVVVLSADSKTALTGSYDETARVWDAATGAPIGKPFQHRGRVRDVALSADGKIALTASEDKMAHLWLTANGERLAKPLRHQDFVIAVALSADGKTALTGSRDNTARLWETASGEPIGPPLKHQGWVVAVAVNADSKTALTGSEDKTARLWETVTGQPIGTPLRHQDAVVTVALSADGKTALTGSADNTAWLLETATAKPIGPPLQHQDSIWTVALSADGKTALTGSEDKTARLWETASGKLVSIPLAHQDFVVAVALSADGKTALTGSRDKTARLWDTATGAQVRTLSHQDFVVAVALSADGKIALTGSRDHTARLWKTATGDEFGMPLRHLGAVVAVALSADGKTALTGSEDKTAQLWDTATGKPLGPVWQHQGTVSAVAFSADGKSALTGCADKTARMWQTAAGAEIGRPLQLQSSVTAMALDADGKTVLAGSDDKSARLLETATGKPIGPPLQHLGRVTALTLSADGKTALTGSADNTARLWETPNGKPIGPPLQHYDAVSAAALSGDAKIALTGSADKLARLWKVPQPIRGDPERIILWTQVVTGLDVDEMAVIRILDAAAWSERRTRLNQLGGPPLE